MMMQANISFDTYYGRIIDPLAYKALGVLKASLGTDKGLPTSIHNTLYDLIKIYVDKLAPQAKNEYKQQMYYILMNAFVKLKKANIPLKDIIDPQDERDYILFKLYLLPILDLMATIHPQGQDYCSFMYSYLVDDKIQDIPELYILENEYSPNIKLISINPQDFPNYIKEKGLLTTIAGTLFYTHETKKGVVYQFLVDRLAMRKEYKKKMYSFPSDSEEYKFYDRYQNSAKVNANSSYGVSGQASFRFSNHHMAKTITINGKFMLKIAQLCGDLYLQNYKK